MKCLAQSQGPKIRVNAVCPGLMLTEWVCLMTFKIVRIQLLTISQGQQFSQDKIDAMTDKMTLKKLVCCPITRSYIVSDFAFPSPR